MPNPVFGICVVGTHSPYPRGDAQHVCDAVEARESENDGSVKQRRPRNAEDSRGEQCTTEMNDRWGREHCRSFVRSRGAV